MDYSTELLGSWEGYAVQSVSRLDPQGPEQRPQVHITLRRAAPTSRCSSCGQACAQVHDATRRCVRDLPILDADTYIWSIAIGSPAPPVVPRWQTSHGCSAGPG